MSNLKQLRSRLKSIQSTQKITKAMQMVSASKLKRAKDDLLHASALQDISVNIMHNVILNMHAEGISDPLLHLLSGALEKVGTRTQLLIIFSSDRGLCGSYNSSLFKALNKHMSKFPLTKLIVFGRKGYDYCKNHYLANIEQHFMISSACEHLSEVTALLSEKAIKGELESCNVLFGYFKNAISQEITNTQIIPLCNDEVNKVDAGEIIASYEFEGETLIATALELYLSNAISYFYAQSKASEEGARTTAMDNATRNAGDMIDSLRLKLNRTRQSMITTELIEIISGAEAV